MFAIIALPLSTTACGSRESLPIPLGLQGASTASPTAFHDAGTAPKDAGQSDAEPAVYHTRDLALGSGYTCILLDDRRVACWGRYIDPLWDSDSVDIPGPKPVLIEGVTGGIADIIPGEDHVCVRTESQDLWCWGLNNAGQLGVGDSPPSLLQPTHVASLGGSVASAAAGGAHTCACTPSGELWCWGADWHGQLGQHHTWHSTPVRVSVLEPAVTAVTAGWGHTCAIDTAGEAWCWGYNDFGQLGVGPSWEELLPVKVPLPAGHLLELAAGAEETCARIEGAPLLCFGINLHGGLGDGTQSLEHPYGKASPVEVIGVSDPDAIALGGWHACALQHGTVWCWGSNTYGQVGTGEADSDVPGGVLVPTQVVGLPDDIVAIAAGELHTCAATADAVWCWGSNDAGQAAPDQQEFFIPTPTRVSLEGLVP